MEDKELLTEDSQLVVDDVVLFITQWLVCGW